LSIKLKENGSRQILSSNLTPALLEFLTHSGSAVASAKLSVFNCLIVNSPEIPVKIISCRSVVKLITIIFI
jgi:hypothetical protein